MIVTAREFNSAAEMRAAAAAVHLRCLNPPAFRPVVVELVEKPASPERIESTPVWSLQDVQFDAHLVEWRDRMALPPKAYVRDRCRELGVSLADIVGSGRNKVISNIRHQLVWEVKQKFDSSYPALGRLFGGRDHTTMLHSIRKIENMRGAE